MERSPTPRGRGGCVGRVWLGGGGRFRVGPAQPRLRFPSLTARAGLTAPFGSFPFCHEAPPTFPFPHLRPGRSLTWQTGPWERPARARPSSGSGPTAAPARAAVREGPSQAHARGGGSPARSHFRRAGASAVPGRCSARRPAVRAGDAARRSREAPEAGLRRLPRERQVRGWGPETRAGPLFSQ